MTIEIEIDSRSILKEEENTQICPTFSCFFIVVDGSCARPTGSFRSVPLWLWVNVNGEPPVLVAGRDNDAWGYPPHGLMFSHVQPGLQPARQQGLVGFRENEAFGTFTSKANKHIDEHTVDGFEANS